MCGQGEEGGPGGGTGPRPGPGGLWEPWLMCGACGESVSVGSELLVPSGRQKMGARPERDTQQPASAFRCRQALTVG